MTDRVTTDGRIFVARMIRDIRKREQTGAEVLAPGTKTWRDALTTFSKNMQQHCKGPIDAGRVFAAARDRLIEAHTKHNTCYVNSFMSRKRSGFFELFTHEVSKHPITRTGYDGIQLAACYCRLQRNGLITMGGCRVGYVTWHALGRMYERTNLDAERANVLIGLIGLTGYLMRISDEHANSGINLAHDDFLCTGVLRVANGIRFFDCLTVLPNDEPKYAQQVDQGIRIANAVSKYVGSGDANPNGYSKNDSCRAVQSRGLCHSRITSEKGCRCWQLRLRAFFEHWNKKDFSDDAG